MAPTAELPAANQRYAADPPRKPQHHKIKIELKGESVSSKDESASEKSEYAHTEAKTESPKVEYTVANATTAGPAESIPDMDLHVGDTVTYSTDAVAAYGVGVAKIRIVFPDCSPFREDHYKGTEVEVLVNPSGGGAPLTLKAPGTMPSQCYLVLTDGRVFGWSKDYPAGGGDYHVRKP